MDEERRSPRRRARTALLAAAALGLAGLLLVAYGFVALHENWFPFHSATPRAVSLEEARRRFLERRIAESTVAPFTPAAGVYEYAGSGTESLSNPARTQPEGPVIPGTVTHEADGCWTFRLDFSTNHWRSWRYCVSESELEVLGSVVYQRWDFGTFGVDNTTTMRCAPPSVVMTIDMAVGDAWPAKCRGESTAISGTTISNGRHRLVAVEQIRVGERLVDAFHFRDSRTVSGAQDGTERFDVWLSAEGLVLKGTQRITVDSPSPIGDVTYDQRSTFSLVRTDPAT